MIYKLSTTQDTYKEPDKKLASLGFTFRYTDAYYFISGRPCIEINTIEELNKFIEKFGQIVLTTNTIEIYNGYREI